MLSVCPSQTPFQRMQVGIHKRFACTQCNHMCAYEKTPQRKRRPFSSIIDKKKSRAPRTPLPAETHCPKPKSLTQTPIEGVAKIQYHNEGRERNCSRVCLNSTQLDPIWYVEGKCKMFMPLKTVMYLSWALDAWQPVQAIQFI